MEGPSPRFRCPPEFEVAPGGVPMGGPQTELWLIRAPADFCPQSLEGCPVPLTGLERLRPAPGATTDGDNDTEATELYVLRGGPAGGGDCPLLLSPLSPGGSLGCAPPLRGSLSITRSFGATPGPGEGTPRVALGDTATAEGTVPPREGTEGTEGPGPPRAAPEEPKRRKKRKKQKREEGQE
ncbi:DNA-directed RNA polymerase I subunit RPA34 [Haemorhous mexicanus]|uniref:DNA-directed RNA polymerase I subunit RPA34 n=1 Tax=Haemorhous mexicanus TaxID=30427 RepID=UPI0028BD5038|nr:DNA-directed RNA polymerase I subunit RPA34 [Haemorhous mexicanus]